MTESPAHPVPQQPSRLAAGSAQPPVGKGAPEHTTLSMPLRPYQVWPYSKHEGYRRAVESAGSVAAPLLAGFSLTLLGLIVPSFADERTTAIAPGGLRVITEKDEFSAAPEAAAGLLLLAGLLLIFSVQAAVTVRRHDHTPSEIKDLWPQHFPESKDGDLDTPDVPDDLKGWDYTQEYSNAEPIRVGRQWYSGFVRAFLYSEWEKSDRAADQMRALYHSGILSLLAGLTALVLPPPGDGSIERWILVAIPAAGFAVEAVWIWSGSDLRGKWKKKRRREPLTEEVPQSAERDTTKHAVTRA